MSFITIVVLALICTLCTACGWHKNQSTTAAMNKTENNVTLSTPTTPISNKLTFPPGFMWGTATSSYQIEGGSEHRGRTIWDDFSETPGKVVNGDTGKVAIDHYNRYREDIKLLADLGTKYYRFSIAWARLFPTPDGKISMKGVQFYWKILTQCRLHGITPLVTLYHWDLPVWVQNKTKGGWVGDGSVADEFEKYARACFENFGNEVKWWITINEPWVVSAIGYEVGEHAPGENDAPGRKVYIAGHNLLRAHAKAVTLYRARFSKQQKGKIGITLDLNWAEPRGGPEAKIAAKRHLEWRLGWFAHPVWIGDYPQVMKDEVGDRLPSFTAAELKQLKGSSDFFGLNHYSTAIITGLNPPSTTESFWGDRRSIETEDPKWQKTDMGWSIVPRGLSRALIYITKTYRPPGGIIVTENGLAAQERTVEEMQNQSLRISFYERYISAIHEAIKAGADCRGYMLWSAFDNFEWAFGYTKRFGLYYVDFKTQKRIAKPAVAWYKKVVSENAVKGGFTDEEMGLPKM